MKVLQANALKAYQFESWDSLNHAIFTRRGGVSAAPWASLNLGGNVGDDTADVRRNHMLMYEAMDVNGARACTVWQVHGADTVLVNHPVQGRRWAARADSMITNMMDTPLVMRYADCTPLLFYDAKKQAVGIAHAGWRGTVIGVGANTVQAMVDAFGSDPMDIQVGIGPAIGPNRYQVGEEVVQAVKDYFGTTDNLIRRDPADGTAYFDLWAANELDVRRAGVAQVEVAGICTSENVDEFFSHRAENGRTGRFGAVITL